MYMRWATAEPGYKISLMDKQDAEVAGLKSAILEISKGENAYGWLKSETVFTVLSVFHLMI